MVLSSASNILNAIASTGSMGVNCLKSTDGKTTRLVITKDGVVGGKGLWFFEELKNVESYWADDLVMGVVACTPTGLSNTSSSFMRLSTEHKGRATCMSADQYLVTTTSTEVRVAMASASGGWSVFPCGYLVDTGATKGRIGDFCDLWFAPDVLPTKTYFASSLGGNFQFVNVGGVVLPWVGTAMVLP
jgi:hypothetical protein